MIPRWLALAAVCAWALAAPGRAVAVDAWVPAGKALYRAPVKSLVDLRYDGMVRQAYDLSCGAAALATLMKFFFGEDLNERDVILGILDGAELKDRAKIAAHGFSMLEMKRYAQSRGYVGEGYELTKPESLELVSHPFIALTEVRGYKHFVVVRGVRGGTVFVADPAYGNRKVSVESFRREWISNRILLFVEKETVEYFTAQGAMPSAVVERVASFVSDGRVPPARMDEVQMIMNHGFRPLQPTAGSFR